LRDLKQVADEQLKLTVLTERSSLLQPILAYYGLTRDRLESWGGKLNEGFGGESGGNREDFDRDLMRSVAERYLLEIVPVPIGLLKGVTNEMTTLARNRQTVFAREDLDDEFAYTVAKVLDENRSKFKYLNRPYFCDPRTVWKGIVGVPLHAGAERYYRDVGYV
jgi:hypothetical protein